MESFQNGEIGFTVGRWPLVAGLPTLVFLHGSSADSRMWDHQIAGLTEVANTLAIDLPGHGRSGGRGHDTVAAYARAAVDFVRSSSIPFPVPCGLSIGGAIALQLLLDYREVFPAAVLIGTGARLRVLPEILQMIVEDYPTYLSQIDRMSAADTTDRERLRPFTEAAERCDPQVAWKDFTACDRFDVMDRLGKIRQPVLVVVGSEDRLTPPKYADFLQRSLARAKRADVPAAGHLVPLEQPEAVNRILSEFVMSLTPTAE